MIPNREDTLEKGMAYSLQYSWLENSMDRGAWRAIVHIISESDMTGQHTHTHTHTHTQIVHHWNKGPSSQSYGFSSSHVWM